MRFSPPIFLSVLSTLMAGCVIVTTDTDPSPSQMVPENTKTAPARLNIQVGLDCLPTCALIGADLHRAGKAITAAYRDSGSYDVTPSDRVEFIAHIKLYIERVNDWLDGKSCHASFGLLPAVWHDHLRMTTTFTNAQGAAPRRFETGAEIDYYCHFFLSPLAPFVSDKDALGQVLTALTRQTIASDEVSNAYRSGRLQAGSSSP